MLDAAGNILMEWQDPSPFGISHFGVRTAWGSSGKWRVCTVERPEILPCEYKKHLRSDTFSTDILSSCDRHVMVVAYLPGEAALLQKLSIWPIPTPLDPRDERTAYLL